MASYYARVELHGASWPEDYEDLHTALAKHGFTNCAPYGDGSKRLPTGFYYATDRTDDYMKVCQVVCDIARDTGYKYEVVVIRESASAACLSKKC